MKYNYLNWILFNIFVKLKQHDMLKNAIITGGGSGIGLAIAERFVRSGIRVIITGRDEEKLQKAKLLLGENCFAYPLNVTDGKSINEFINWIEKEFTSIDILVNNAGVHLKKPFVEMTHEDFEKVVNVNQTAVFNMSREVAKNMAKNSNGSIIHISSMAAHYGIPNVMGYTASKGALEAMTRAMAVELTPLGIRVNAVAPGFIETDMSRKALSSDPERKRRILERTPMRKLGQPAHIANAVYFLASPESEFISGVVLPVDGGNSIGF